MNPEEKTTGLPPQEERKPFKTLRTYQGDIDEIMSKGQASATTILVAEQKRKEEAPQKMGGFQKDNKPRNRFFMILGGVLLLLGAVIIPTVYYIRTTEEVVQVKQTKALLGFSDEKTISLSGLTKEKFIERIISEKNSFKLHPNSILYLNTVDESNNPEEVSKVLLLLSGRIPSALARSFSSKYMFGIYSFDTNEPFIILTTDDFAESYAGMLKWEKDIGKDLGRIFNISQNIENETFVDEEYRNKDLRILKDANNKAVLLYSFIDKKTLVITTNENILSAIIGKYVINQQTK